MNGRIRSIAGQALIAALFMCFYGWFASAKGISESEAYNTIVDIFFWMLRIGGLLMLLVAALCYFEIRAGLLMDAVLSGLCAAVMLLYGVSGVMTGVGISLNHLLVMIFAVMFLSAARTSFLAFQLSVTVTPGPKVRPQEARIVEPIHPASVRSSSLPAADEPAPADGYLAALSREKDEPPTASFK